jgi:hypothetical protein
MDPDRIDFMPLALQNRERLVAAILERAALGAAPRGPLSVVAAWARPTLAAAAAVAALSLVALRPGAATPEPAAPSTVVEALDVPSPVADWLAEGRGPREGDLLVALDELPETLETR